MAEKINKTEYPQLAFLRKQPSLEKERLENEERCEKFFFYLDECLKNEKVGCKLIGVSTFRNVTYLKYKIDFKNSKFAISVHHSEIKYFGSHVEEIIRNCPLEYYGKDEIDFSFDEVDAENGLWHLVFAISHYNFLPVYFSKTFEKARAKGKGIEISFFADENGEPYWVDLEKNNLIMLTDNECGQRKRVAFGGLLSVAFRYSPDEVSFVLMGENDEFSQYFTNEAHMEFGKPLENFEQFYPCVQWIMKKIEERKELFEKGGFEDIRAYNAVNGKKLPFFIVLLSNYASCMQFYDIYFRTIERMLEDICEDCSKYGFTLIITNKTSFWKRPSLFLTSEAKVKMAFKIKDPTYSSIYVGKPGCDKLVDPFELGMTEGDSPFKRMISYEISKEETEKLCALLKEKGERKFNERDYEWICNQSKIGDMNSENRERNKVNAMVKEILKCALGFTFVSVNFLVKFQRFDKALVLLGLEEGLKKGYLVQDGTQYKPNLTIEQFENIFGKY